MLKKKKPDSNANAATAGDSVVCPSCGATVPVVARRCPVCGAPNSTLPSFGTPVEESGRLISVQRLSDPDDPIRIYRIGRSVTVRFQKGTWLLSAVVALLIIISICIAASHIDPMAEPLQGLSEVF